MLKGKQIIEVIIFVYVIRNRINFTRSSKKEFKEKKTNRYVFF